MIWARARPKVTLSGSEALSEGRILGSYDLIRSLTNMYSFSSAVTGKAGDKIHIYSCQKLVIRVCILQYISYTILNTSRYIQTSHTIDVRRSEECQRHYTDFYFSLHCVTRYGYISTLLIVRLMWYIITCLWDFLAYNAWHLFVLKCGTAGIRTHAAFPLKRCSVVKKAIVVLHRSQARYRLLHGGSWQIWMTWWCVYVHVELRSYVAGGYIRVFYDTGL